MKYSLGNGNIQFFGGRGQSIRNILQNNINVKPKKAKDINDLLVGGTGNKGTESELTRALLVSNPNFNKPGTGEKYTSNCQRCVWAYELQRRGYDVEALEYQGTKRLEDPMVFANNWTAVINNGINKFYNNIVDGKTYKQEEQNILKTMYGYGVGARAIIRVGWKGTNSGHVFIAEQTSENKTIFIDPQSNRMLNITNTLKEARRGDTVILRTDNENINNDYLKYFVKERKK